MLMVEDRADFHFPEQVRMASKLSGFISELKRRKVYHVGAAYAAASIVLATATAELYSFLRLPEWTPSLVILLLAIGFPVALVLAWAYEVRPEEPAPAQPTLSPNAATLQQRKSIVVLPFDNLSPDSGDAYFVDGLTEEIITDLSCCGLLRVISRNSAMAYRDTRKGTKVIAEELAVQYVLEGSVRKSGQDLLVTAQLIDAPLDEHVWAERFSGTLQDVFEIQRQLSKSIVDALKLRLTPREEKLLNARPIEESRAYDTYLLAMHESGKFSPEGTARAIRLVKEALAVLGENAFLFSTLAVCYYRAYDMGLSHDAETFAEMEKWASRAMEADPNLSHAQWAMALVHFKKGDLPGYARLGRKAVALSRDVNHSVHLAIILSMMGQLDEARGLAEFSVERDPLSFFSHFVWGGVEIFGGNHELALSRISEAAHRLAEGEAFAHWWEAQAAGYSGDDRRARAVFERVSSMGAGPLSDMSELFVRAYSDDLEGMKAVLDRPDLRDMGKADDYFPVFFANAFAKVGDAEEAIRWLDQAVTWGFCNHTFLSHYNRYLEPLRENPRFLAVLDRAKEKEQALDQ